MEGRKEGGRDGAWVGGTDREGRKKRRKEKKQWKEREGGKKKQKGKKEKKGRREGKFCLYVDKLFKGRALTNLNSRSKDTFNYVYLDQ